MYTYQCLEAPCCVCPSYSKNEKSLSSAHAAPRPTPPARAPRHHLHSLPADAGSSLQEAVCTPVHTMHEALRAPLQRPHPRVRQRQHSRAPPLPAVRCMQALLSMTATLATRRKQLTLQARRRTSDTAESDVCGSCLSPISRWTHEYMFQVCRLRRSTACAVPAPVDPRPISPACMPPRRHPPVPPMPRPLV